MPAVTGDTSDRRRDPHTRPPEVVLVRHGDTEWSRVGRHTGRTDIPLTASGREQAATLRARLRTWGFGLVLVSPLRRARETCAIAGYGDRAVVDDDLMEWDYGEIEGRTTAEWRESHPGWNLWEQGCPGGESVEQVGERAGRVIARVVAAGDDAVLFAHGHLLRILTARWLELPALAARSLALETIAVSVLGWNEDDRVLSRWNMAPDATEDTTTARD
jgi:probable phosphoglycerate mutase